MKTLRFGVVGAGLMGREFASAAARWCHLVDPPARPEIVAVCSRSEASLEWFRRNVPTARHCTTRFDELLANPEVEAVYVAVPHHLHREICRAVLEAGKHLMGEKPFGIDAAANEAILEGVRRRPELLVRCASQWMFYPAAQRMARVIEEGALGRIIEVNAAFLHSSDLDPEKPINWKRQVEYNGEYGVMGDLGMHVCAVPFRARWVPENVRAILSDLVRERPDGAGRRVPCRTWDNATLLCEARDGASGELFPLTIKAQRMAPGQQNTWSLEILGTRTSVRFSTRNPKGMERLEYRGGEQVWSWVETGSATAYQTITGPIFEFGFSDAVLQMWAAFVTEFAIGRVPGRYAACVTPEETALSHRLFTAALRSHQRRAVEPV